MVPLQSLGHEVGRLRRQRGLSVGDVAQRLGVEASLVQRAESAGYGPMFRLRKRLLLEVAGYEITGPYYEIRPAPSRVDQGPSGRA